MSTQTKTSKQGVPSVIDFVVKMQLSRFIAGQTHFLSIDSQWKQIVGQQGINQIAAKIGNALHASIKVSKENGHIIMTPTKITEPGSSKGEQQTMDVQDEKIPRPPNSFILYRQHYHSTVKEEHPEFSNGRVSKALGAKWRDETPEVKDHFQRLAQHLKDAHNKTYPDYTYKPRKTSDKKRRMTPKKASQITALANALKSTDNVDDEANITEVEGPKATLPTFDESPFGDDSKVIDFVFGNPNITPTTLEAMLLNHNKQFENDSSAGPNSFLAEDCLSAAPHELLAQELSFYDRVPAWNPFDSAHMIDNGPLDEQFLNLFVDRNDVSKGLRMVREPPYPGTSEVARQARLLEPLVSNSTNI